MQGRLRLRERIRDGHQRQGFGSPIQVIRQLGHVLSRDARVYGGHKTRLAPSRMPEIDDASSITLPDGRSSFLELPQFSSDLVPVYTTILPPNAALLPDRGLDLDALVQVLVVLVELSYLGYGR